MLCNDEPRGFSLPCGRTTFTANADQAMLLAQSWLCSIVMYLVRTVWELIRLKSDTGPPARIHEEMLRVFAVFLDGFEMMVTGAESNDAHTRSLPVASPPSGAFGDGSAMSRDS